MAFIATDRQVHARVLHGLKFDPIHRHELLRDHDRHTGMADGADALAHVSRQ